MLAKENYLLKTFWPPQFKCYCLLCLTRAVLSKKHNGIDRTTNSSILGELKEFTVPSIPFAILKFCTTKNLFTKQYIIVQLYKFCKNLSVDPLELFFHSLTLQPTYIPDCQLCARKACRQLLWTWSQFSHWKFFQLSYYNRMQLSCSKNNTNANY